MTSPISACGSAAANVNAAGTAIAPGVVIDCKWISSISQPHQRNMGCYINIEAWRSAPVRYLRMFAESDQCLAFRGLTCRNPGADRVGDMMCELFEHRRVRASALLHNFGKRVDAVHGYVICVLELVGAAGVAEIGILEQLIERHHLADQALLMTIALHRLQILAIGGL